MDKQLRIQVILGAVGDKAARALKVLRGGARETVKELKATRDQLKQLEATQRDLSAFKTLKREMQGAGAATAAVEKRIADLAAKQRTAEGSTRKLNAEMKRAKADALALKDAHAAKNLKLEELRRRLNAAGVASGDMARHEARLRSEVARTTTELDKQKRKLAELARQTERRQRQSALTAKMSGFQSRAAIAGGMSLGAGAALARPMLGSVEDLNGVESNMTSIGQKADLTRRQTAALLKTLRATAPAVNQDLDALVDGVDVLTGFGLGADKATAMMKPIGMAATAYKAEIADLSAAAFAAGDNLKVPFDQTGLVIDIMAKAGKLGAVEIKDMAAGFPALTAQAQALGQTGAPAVAELAAALQVVRKGAGDSETAITNLQNLQQKIMSPETIRKFSKAGIDLEKSMKAAAKAGKSPLEAIAEITAKATKGDMAKLGFFFEDAQAQAAIRSLMQNMDEFRSIRAQAMAAGGTTERDFAQRMLDGAEASKAMKLEIKALALDFAATLLPMVMVATRWIRKVTGEVRAWANAHPKLAKALGVTLAAIAGLLLAFGALALVVSAVLGPFIAIRMALLLAAPIFMPIITGIWGMTTALGGMAAALLVNPITWIVLAIVAAIALLAGGVYLIVKNWGPITTWFAGVWARIKAFASVAITAIAGYIMKFTPLGLFIRAFMAVWPWFSALGQKFLSIGGFLLQGLIDGFKSRLGALKDTIVGAAKAAVGWFKQVLGIKSPSRVFAALGGFTMAGLAQGLSKGERQPLDQIKASAARLTAAMAIGVAGPVAAAPAGGVPSAAAHAPAAASAAAITINIYPPPGADPVAIARAVEEALRRRDAQARLTSFQDSGD